MDESARIRKTRRKATNMARRTKTEDPDVTRPDDGLSDDGWSDTESDSIGSDTSSTAGGVVDSAKKAASRAKEAASDVVDQAKDQATSRVDQQRQTAASGVQAVAHALRSMSDDLRNREEGPVVEYAAEIGNAIGGQVERVANYLREREAHQFVSDAEDFARRSPAVFLGGAFVLGLAASRFLKSSRSVSDPLANMPDPNRALPPASTPVASTGTPTSSGSQSTRTPRVRSRSAAGSFSGSDEPGTSGTQGSWAAAADDDLDEVAGL
jgi:hypothetical protein